MQNDAREAVLDVLTILQLDPKANTKEVFAFIWGLEEGNAKRLLGTSVWMLAGILQKEAAAMGMDMDTFLEQSAVYAYHSMDTSRNN